MDSNISIDFKNLDEYDKKFLSTFIYGSVVHNKIIWAERDDLRSVATNDTDFYAHACCPVCKQVRIANKGLIRLFPNKVMGIGCRDCKLNLVRIFFINDVLFTTSIPYPVMVAPIIKISCIDFWPQNGSKIQIKKYRS
jgi:hypothetical protein